MVVVKLNKKILMPIFAICAIILLAGAIVAFVDSSFIELVAKRVASGKNHDIVRVVLSTIGIRAFKIVYIAVGIATFLLCLTFTFSWIPSFKIIFDDYGITIEERMNFLFTIYKNKETFPWSVFFRVDYYSFAKDPGFHFIGSKNIRIHCSNINYKQALAYAVEKLPKDKFTEDAQKKLKKIGVIVS
jgi:hypothetical protein